MYICFILLILVSFFNFAQSPVEDSANYSDEEEFVLICQPARKPVRRPREEFSNDSQNNVPTPQFYDDDEEGDLIVKPRPLQRQRTKGPLGDICKLRIPAPEDSSDGEEGNTPMEGQRTEGSSDGEERNTPTLCINDPTQQNRNVTQDTDHQRCGSER